MGLVGRAQRVDEPWSAGMGQGEDETCQGETSRARLGTQASWPSVKEQVGMEMGGQLPRRGPEAGQRGGEQGTVAGAKEEG